MLPVNLLTAIKLALEPKPPQPAAVAPVEAAAKNGQQFDLNQRFQGMVQAQVAPGVFNVRVAEQLFQMQLPSSVRNGDVIPLQVVSVRPRLTFSIVNSTTATPLSTPEELGSTARLLSAMSRQPPEKAFVQAAQNTPLWEKPQAPDGKVLAGLLREALGNSGLFYESHQAQWVAGARSTAQLRAEPQNLPPDQARAIVAQNSTAAAQEAKTAGVPDHLQPLVQQQLNALETHQMIWQGMIWPGQTMQWEIHDQAASHSPQPEEQRQWVTELRLDLPRLGSVAATLSFNSAGVSLALQADRTETRTMLGSASTDLIAALHNAGIPVRNTTVNAP